MLNLVVKSDVQGSLEAIVDALNKQSTEKVRINIIHGGTGAITESDILLASASDAIIIGFNVRPTARVKRNGRTREAWTSVSIDIIYKLVDEIKSAMAGLLRSRQPRGVPRPGRSARSLLRAEGRLHRGQPCRRRQAHP